MHWNNNLLRLKKELVELFPLYNDIKPIVQETNLSLGKFNFNDNGENIWSGVIVEAHSQGKLLELVRRSRQGYTNRVVLIEIEEWLVNGNSINTEPFPSPDSVFIFNEPLPSISEFIGRVRERNTLLNRTEKGACTSIVGPRRIGKSWLLRYLQLITPEKFGSRYRIAWIDVSSVECEKISGFVAVALEGLGIFMQGGATLGLTELQKAVKDFKAKGIVPVILLDEFEGFGNHQQYDLNFFTELRAMTQIGLCLVTASKSSLLKIVGDIGKTSGFFNVFQPITLKEFNELEIEQFVQVKGQASRFSVEEQIRLKQYGGNWPLKLQLVGKTLLEDKSLAATEHPSYYRPAEADYWEEFEQRINEIYAGVVG